MRQFRREYLFLAPISVLLLGAPTSIHASSMDRPDPRAPDSLGFLTQSGDWRANLDLRRWAASEFHKDYTNIVIEMTKSHGEERTTRTLDFAELLASHMLLREAASAVEGVTPVSKDNVARHKALAAAITLLRGMPSEDFADSALTEGDRPDFAFWTTLNAIANGDPAQLLSELPGGFAGLSYQSAAVLRGVLPAFTEAAIQTGQTDLAALALRLLEEIPDLAAAPVGYYLRGLYARQLDNNSSALLAFLEASQGYDRYAARSRLALADMAVEDGGRGALLAARDTLTDGINAWRGEPYELDVLSNLARLNEDLGDGLDALLIHAQIMTRYGGTEEALASRASADGLMGEIYERGASGDVSLADWVNVHFQIMPFLRNEPAFVLHTELLADRALELGGTDLARREYERALQLIDVGSQRSTYEVPENAENRLVLKLARAHYEGGRYETALDLLMGFKDPVAHWIVLDATDLRAKILFKLDRKEDFLMQPSHADTAQRLRQRATASSQQGKWDQAKVLLSEMLDAHREEFEMRDAVNLLIAAKRTDDDALANKVTYLFPDLTQSTALLDLAKSVASEPDMIGRLGAEHVLGRLQRYKSTMEDVNGINVSQ